MRSRFFCGVSAVAVALTLGAYGVANAADDQVEATADSTLTAVNVEAPTGSFIARETSALPVDVVGNQELEDRGAPSMVQFVKTIPSSGAVIGENNRFGGGNGGSTINLRGLGGTRTLVLLNGRRLPGSPQGLGAVDLNLLPQTAIGRVEVLKDGAAATYGSDAVGGVVNFITRTDLDGWEFSVDYQMIRDSKGDYNLGAAYGNRGDNYTFLATFDYRVRSELSVKDRDWALRTGPEGYRSNPLGGWASTGNPGRYNIAAAAPVGSPDTGFTSFGFSAVTGNLLDIGCAANGGAPYAVGSATPSATTCQFQYTAFDNLVEDETHYQAYTLFTVDLNDDLAFRLEGLYALNRTPFQAWALTGPNQYPAPILASGGSPGGGVSPLPASGTGEQSNFYIPATNPGLVAFLAQLGAANCAGPVLPYGIDVASCTSGLAANQAQLASAAANGVIGSPTAWRPNGFGGAAYTNDNKSHYTYKTTTFRIATGFSGTIFDNIHWDAGVTYQSLDTHYNLEDTSVDRLQLALRGYGSVAGAAPCTAAATANFTANAGTGNCHYFNPFTNAFAQSLSPVAANPYYIASSAIPGFNDAVASRAGVIDWMVEQQFNEIRAELLVVDLVFAGDTGFKLMADDSVQWAIGAQSRYDRTKQTPDVLYDANATPCVDSPPFGDGTPFCPTTSNGPFLFNANLRPYDVSRNIYAAFFELRVPVTNELEFTLAGRTERYEGIGTTSNPKISFRWQALDWLAFRGSAGTTYRAPVATATTNTFTRGLSNASGTYRANDLYGNPNLKPETARTFDIGGIVRFPWMNATLDYWNFDFKNQLTTEATSDLLAVLGGHCGDAAYAAVQNRITFTGAACTGTAVNTANILSYRTLNINGGGIKTSGLDFQVNFTFNDVMGGNLSFGVDGTYLLTFKEAPYNVEGFPTAGGVVIDRVGKFRPDIFTGYNRIRANGYVNFHYNNVNVRWQTRYVSSTENSLASYRGLLQLFGDSTTVAAYWQHDITARIEVPSWQAAVTLGIQNILDRDPPYAGTVQYNYDFGSGNPLGRVFVIGLKKQF